jgi:hypothetical protein
MTSPRITLKLSPANDYAGSTSSITLNNSATMARSIRMEEI